MLAGKASIAIGGHLLDRVAFGGLGMLFKFRDLRKTPGVSAPLKLGSEPNLDHAVDQTLAKEISREAQDVGVVVKTAHFGGQIIVAGRGAHAGEFIGDNAHTDPGPTNEDSAIDILPGNRPRDLRGEVGIVDVVRAIGPPDRAFRVPVIAPVR